MNMSQLFKSATDEYWKTRWVEGSTDWHRNTVERNVQTHVSFLCGGTATPNDLPPDSSDSSQHAPPTVFIPLCGKSLDMVWLADQGFSVVGCELSELAIEQFFQENAIPFDKSSIENFTVYKAKAMNLELYAGNVFDFKPSIMGLFDAVWDSKAIVAINYEDRSKYADTLMNLLKPKGRILMSASEFESKRNCVPLSVSEGVIVSLFESQCSVKLVKKTSLSVKEFDIDIGSWINNLVFYIEK